MAKRKPNAKEKAEAAKLKAAEEAKAKVEEAKAAEGTEANEANASEGNTDNVPEGNADENEGTDDNANEADSGDSGDNGIDTTDEEVGDEEESPAGKIVLEQLDKAFSNLSKAFKNDTATLSMQRVLFATISKALDIVPHRVPETLEELAGKYENTVDTESLRFDHLWEDQEEKAAYNTLIAMLAFKVGTIDPYYMDSVIIRTVLKAFGDNGYYLATLHTPVEL